jgi:prepilin-type N-terminal cleavage/methylation domain-containing protein
MTATASTLSVNHCRRCDGFSLIELAVVIFVIALLLGGIFIPLQTQVESRNYDQTQRILDQAREALLGYAAAYGYLPCPADYGLVSDGAEAAGSLHTTGVCDSAGADSVLGGATTGVYVGYFPAVTLGFTPIDSNGYALDAWGLQQNRIRYAVSFTTVNGITNPFTRTSGLRSAGMSNIMAATLLSVCSTGTGTTNTACASASTTLTSNAVAVIWSLGPNAATSGGAAPHESHNAESLAASNRTFVKADLSKVTGAEFDDVVTWISPAMLFNRMIAAGQLP